MRRIALVAAALVISTGVRLAFADEASCGTVDMSSEFGSHRDQGDFGDCFAMATSDLLGHAMNIRPPDKISAMDVYSRYISMDAKEFFAAQDSVKFVNLKEHPPGVAPDSLGWKVPAVFPNVELGIPLMQRWGGYSDIAAAEMIRKGMVCMESEVPSQSLTQDSVVRKNYYQESFRISSDNAVTNSLNQQKEIIRNFKPLPQDFFTRKLLEWSDTSSLSFGFLQHVELCKCEINKPFIFKFLNFNSSLQAHTQDWAVAKLRSSIDNVCKNPKPIGPLSVTDSMFHGSDRDIALSKKTMQDHLNNRKPFVLGVHWCDLAECAPSVPKTNHAILAVGRKWNKNTQSCDVQLHNSAGSLCPQSLHPWVYCDGGDIFVPMNVMASLNHEIMSIDKAAK